jgi:pantoate--beta-alanine ligase
VSVTVFENISSLRDWISEERGSGRTLGFVPTMGALHMGHISLIERAKEACDVVVVSVFVNPTQFNNPDDLKKYPRTIEEDISLLSSSSCDALFCPTEHEIYPEPQKLHWDFGLLSHSLEAHYRPGHFDGVLTVVKRLFEIVQPDQAFFGEKDYQQLSLIRRMTKHEGFKIEVVGCPIIREHDGLAMSSRNRRLNAKQREQSIVISKTLFQMLRDRDKYNPMELRARGMRALEDAEGIVPEYLEIVDGPSFSPIRHWSQSLEPIVLVAVFIGEVRLIDTISLQ